MKKVGVPMKRLRINVLASLLLPLLIIAGCRSQNAPPAGQRPSSAADLNGIITRVMEQSILVEENPAEKSGSAKAVVRITAETEVVSSRGATPELRAGQRISVWFSGPVAESYPVQGTAARIELHD